MKKDNLLSALLAPAALLLTAMLGTASCSQDENEPDGTLPGSKITLVPTVAPTLSWSTGDGTTTSDTRVDASLPVTLTGGEICVALSRPSAGGGTPGKDDLLGCNYYSVSADGKLTRLPFNNRLNETETSLAIGAPGEYYVKGEGNAILTSDGIIYDAFISSPAATDTKITIGADGSVALPLAIKYGGLRLNLKSDSGTSYGGTDIIAKPLNFTRYDGTAFAEKTLTPDASSVIWGDFDSQGVTAGTEILQLSTGGHDYRVLASRQISFTSGRLYTFNVRVGATGITVSSDDLGIADFDVESVTNAEAKIMSVWDGTIPAGQSTGSAFSGGDGKTEATAYVIGKAADLAQLAADVNAGCVYYGKYFKQTIGIDLANKPWTPIGVSGSFSGHYNGKGYAIINLKSDGVGNGFGHTSGLFGYVSGSSVSLKNIHVQGIVTGYESAGICVNFSGSSPLTSSTGDNQVISSCSFTGTVEGGQNNSQTAGICASANNAFITSCANYGSITLTMNHTNIGGIVGGGSDYIVAGCYNAGKLSYTGGGDGDINIGCIAGGSATKVIGCYNIGTVDLTGIVHSSDMSITNNNISDSYAIAPICNSSFASGVTAFGASWIPASGTWTADPDNDGTFSYSSDAFQSAKFWKSLGGWNGGNPVYPKLWWE